MSVAQFEINAEPRNDVGKGASRRLRHAEKVPAVIYGGGQDPQAVTLVHNIMLRYSDNEALYTSILDISVAGQAEKVVLKDMQWHPYKPVIMHMDFLRVDETTIIKVNVPVHFINEDIAPGVKAGGVASHLMTNIAVSSPAGKVPEYLEVDVAHLELGESVHLSEVTLPEGVSIVELSHGDSHDQAVVTVMATRSNVTADDEAGEAEETEETSE